MIEIIAQAVKKSADKVVKVVSTPTPTPVPEAQTGGLNMENFLTDFFSFFANFDYQLVFKAIIMVVLFMWLLVVMWVILDASQRYKRWYVVVLWIVLILPFNLLGLLAYFAIRPHYTNEEQEWSKLEIKYLEHELLSTTHCRHCHKMVQVDHQFCWHCGEDLQWECRGCEHRNSIGYQYCINCGLVAAVTIEAHKPKAMPEKKENSVENKKEKQVENLSSIKKKSKFRTLVRMVMKKMAKYLRVPFTKLGTIWRNYQRKKKEKKTNSKSVELSKDSFKKEQLNDSLEGKSIEDSLETYFADNKKKEGGARSRIKNFYKKKKRRKSRHCS